MPDDQHNNDQPPIQPDEQPTPAEMPRPMDEPVPDSNDTPADTDEARATALDAEPATPNEPAPEAQPTEQPEPQQAVADEAADLPPVQPAPSFQDEEPISANDPFTHAATVHPDPAAPMTAPQPGTQTKKQGRKKGLVAGTIAIIVAVMLIGGTAAGYFLWYQNPDKVIMDSLVKTINVESASYAGKITFEGEDLDLKLDIDGQLSQDGSANMVTATITPKNTGIDVGSITTSGEAIVASDSTLYIKLKDVQDAYEVVRDALVQNIIESYAESGFTFTSEQISAMRSQVDTMFQPIVEKLEGQWIKVTPDDIDQTTNSPNNTVTCVSDAFKKATKDGTFSDEIVQAYQDNAFMVVAEDLGVQDGNQGYVLNYDDDRAQAFSDATDETQLAKDVMACNDSDAAGLSNNENTDSLKEQRFELWVDQWTHEPTRIVAQGTTASDSPSTFNIDMTMDLNASTDIAPPEDAKSLDEVLDFGGDSSLMQLFGA